MGDRIRFLLKRISERLWVRPLALCVLSVIGAFLAKAADNAGIESLVPEITPDSIETLLGVMASSMLVIATFAVASMVSAYSSASNVATPRTFPLVIADDVSQNALSTYIGAFIFSIVSLIALKNGYYGIQGRFALFSFTLVAFAIVIVTFVRWVDRIARLGRLGATIDKVEEATAEALKQRRRQPTLGGVAAKRGSEDGEAVFSGKIGYVQRVDVEALQEIAEELEVRITVAALPGAFSAPGRAVAYVSDGEVPYADSSRIADTFLIRDDRVFDEDPRFGLIVLSEIGSRALSPAVNDPGTAIDIIGTLVRLFALWSEPLDESDQPAVEFDRVAVPELALDDMFHDGFSPIARDGAGTVEVTCWLQKAFASLASIDDDAMQDVARRHSRLALARAERALDLPHDLEIVRALAGFSDSR